MKLFAFLLALALLITLSACGSWSFVQDTKPYNPYSDGCSKLRLDICNKNNISFTQCGCREDE